MDKFLEAAVCGLRWGRADGVPVSRAAVVAEARTWLGTPFMHQQQMKGVGADCGGLVRGVSVALGLIPANFRELVPQRLVAYSRNPEGELGRQLCDLCWRPINPAQLQPGDVVLIRWNAMPFPQHSAIVSDYVHGGLAMIHALGPSSPRKVVEHSMRWLSTSSAGNRPRLEAAYSLPGVE